MRQFYLSKNNHGYYRVVFVDPETGWQSCEDCWAGDGDVVVGM